MTLKYSASIKIVKSISCTLWVCFRSQIADDWIMLSWKLRVNIVNEQNDAKIEIVMLKIIWHRCCCRHLLNFFGMFVIILCKPAHMQKEVAHNYYIFDIFKWLHTPTDSSSAKISSPSTFACHLSLIILSSLFTFHVSIFICKSK